ncbi:rhodanese-like domain-containing protein [Gillisia sp. Hel_I_86]|uniref:rhodanese-like domain-containing protein n=1 Tax=Gillisia sp. Hel_I_86 TaxID=1249981 RepID=UPI00119A49BA|nr:rhodanese-like domain-containing protein [Gillisia sp. Hel_I_86]TVZ27434.1 rhodanese-like domain-containing protein [Gillisia sp. Hel_I_86]
MVRVFFSLVLITVFSQGCVQPKAKEIHAITPAEVRTEIKYAADKTEVQSKKDFKKSHLINAESLVAKKNVRERLNKLDKGLPIAVYFTSENKSHEAALILQDLGFQQIYILDGGIKKWTMGKIEAK